MERLEIHKGNARVTFWGTADGIWDKVLKTQPIDAYDVSEEAMRESDEFAEAAYLIRFNELQQMGSLPRFSPKFYGSWLHTDSQGDYMALILMEHIQRHWVTPSTWGGFLVQVAFIATFLHEKLGILHGDLRRPNVIPTYSPTTQICYELSDGTWWIIETHNVAPIFIDFGRTVGTIPKATWPFEINKTGKGKTLLLYTVTTAGKNIWINDLVLYGTSFMGFPEIVPPDVLREDFPEIPQWTDNIPKTWDYLYAEKPADIPFETMLRRWLTKYGRQTTIDPPDYSLML